MDGARATDRIHPQEQIEIMAIQTIRIHPAIGVARVGNAKDDFFIGPERPMQDPSPPGGFKNDDCEIRRQGARFRLYAYDENDTLVGEVTASGADSIRWTVHLVNRKATSPTTSPNSDNGFVRNSAVTGTARDAMVIDPGSRILDTPNAIATFDTGTFSYPVGGSTQTRLVPLGEMRTDAEGRLVVLGGFGDADSIDAASFPIVHFYNNPGWYDDVSDGPVTATVIIDGVTYTAEAWVICGPPDYGPASTQVHTLYDHLIQQHWPPSAGQVGNGGTPSYTHDVYPLLRRAASVKWTRDSQQPVTLDLAIAHLASSSERSAIVTQIQGLPGGITTQQADILTRWKDGNFDADWVGSPALPAITPEGLDRAALAACIGAPFYPGIEAGVWVDDASHFSSELRIDHATVQPGDVTQKMALPWQADFHACSGDSWWPTQRPNKVVVAGSSTKQNWARNIDSMTEMVTEWSDAGFVVPQGDQQIEVEHCVSPSILLRTPVVTLHAEQGPGGMARWVAAPIVFEITSPSSAVTLQITSPLSGAFAVETTGPVSVPAGSTAAEIRLWVRYQSQTTPTAGTPDDTAVTVSEVGGARTWIIELVGHTTARTQTLVALVLDRSGSMSGDRGDGMPKIDSLREASEIFVDAMLEQDAVAVVRYNHDAQSVVDPPQILGDQTASDPARQAVKAAIGSSQLSPAGATSIGDGIELARGILETNTSYAERAMVVLTDGNENSAKFIAEVSSSIDDQVFAVGLGRPENTSTAALQTLSGQHGGYMLVTGDITPDKEHLLTKYFLQILAGLSNAEVVLDPDAQILPGDVHEVPFLVSEATYGLDVFLLADAKELRFAVRTPAGELITPKVAAARHPAMSFVPREHMQLYRLAIPAEVTKDRPAREGHWTAIVYRPQRRIEVDGPFTDSLARAMHTHERERALGDDERAIPYSVMVNAYTDLRIEAFAAQASREPGSRISLGVSATQWGIPLTDLRAYAELTSPGGRTRGLELEPGFGGLATRTLELHEPGVHKARIRIAGRSRAGVKFERETTRTFTVWPGGDQSPRPSGFEDGVIGGSDDELARRLLLELLRCRGRWNKEIEKRLHDCGLDPDEWKDLVEKLGERIASKDGPTRDTAPLPGFGLRKRLRTLVHGLLGDD